MLEGEHALTIVSGPAGSGKSTLLAQWAISHDESGPALLQVAFGAEVTNAQAVWREALEQLSTYDLIEDTAGLAEDVRGFDSLRDPIATVHRIFDELRGPCILIIDNFERSDELSFLAELVRLLGHATNLSVVVSTRRSLTAKPLQLLAETDTAFIGPADLLFTADEAREVIERISHQPAPPESVGDISALPISARIIGLSRLARQWPVVPETGRATVADALMSRLITEDASPEFREFLLCTALPSIVTVEIASRLGWADSAVAHLELAETYGLGMWEAKGDAVGFAYTPVLREALIRHIEKRSPREVQEFRRAVAQWAFESDHQLEALENALDARDYHLASRFVRKSWFMLAQTVSEEAIALLKRQGPVVLNKFPVLSTAMALFLLARGHRLRAFGYFQSAVLSSRRRGGPDDDPTEQFWAMTVQSLAERLASQFDRAEASAQKVYDLYVSMGDAKRAELESTISLLLSNCAISFFYARRVDDAITVLEWGMSVQVPDDDAGWYNCASTMAGIKAIQGKLNAARRVLDEIDAADIPVHWRTDHFGFMEQIARAHLAVADLDFERAQSHLDSVAHHLGATENWPFFVCAQSDVYLLAGRSADALRVIDGALEKGANSKTSKYGMDYVHGRRMLVLLSLGNLPLFDRAFDSLGPPIVARAMGGFRALLIGQPEAAVTALGSIAAGVDTIKNFRFQVHSLLIFALASSRIGQPDSARNACEQAVAMLNEERTLSGLMMFTDEELVELRDASEGDTAEFFDKARDRIPRKSAKFRPLPPPVPLTTRERAVLRELVKTGSTTAIASALFVSPNTVKVQRGSAYRKLGVSSREEALVRAAALGLLGDDVDAD